MDVVRVVGKCIGRCVCDGVIGKSKYRRCTPAGDGAGLNGGRAVTSDFKADVSVGFAVFMSSSIHVADSKLPRWTWPNFKADWECDDYEAALRESNTIV